MKDTAPNLIIAKILGQRNILFEEKRNKQRNPAYFTMRTINSTCTNRLARLRYLGLKT